MTLHELLEKLMTETGYGGQVMEGGNGDYISFPFRIQPTIAWKKIKNATPAEYNISLDTVNDGFDITIRPINK